MKNNLDDMLKFYCETEIDDLCKDSVFITLKELVLLHGFNIKLDFGKAKKEKRNNLYLSLEVFDRNDKIIEIFDEGFLSISTMLVLEDKKERYKFFPWKDEEFMDDLNWIIKQITNL